MAPHRPFGAARGWPLPPGQVVGGFSPAVLTAPSVAGVAAAGATLTATPGSYGGATAVAGQWQRNGMAITGATGASYTVQASDGPNVSYREVATNSQGSITQRALAQYKGQVANRCYIHDTTANSNKQMMSRSPHVAGDTLTTLQVYLANWFWDRAGTKTETGSGGTATYTASIEYPAGTFTQVKFAGATSGTANDTGVLVSDAVTISIPKGATFWVRVFCQAATGIVFDAGYTSGPYTYSNCDLANGQAMTYGASGVADQTMGGTVVNTATSNYPAWTPLAIVAPTTVPSVAIFGDSREHGTGDALDGTMTGLGATARQLDALGVPWINVGCHGDLMATAAGASAFAKRKGAATVVSLAVSEGGINDVTTNNVNPLASLQAIWAQLAVGVPVYQKTLQPVSASTDSWATTVNQTRTANDATRVAFNTAIRAGGVLGLTGYVEDADVVESARDSGLWKPGRTSDGTHANASGYALLRTGSALTAAALAR